MEDGLSCLTEASTNTQGAGALRDRKPDAGLASRLAHVRCALPLLRPRPEPTHSAHCGLSSALPGEARARARPAALARLLTPVAMARMHPQAQNEAQRLTQALHDEKRRADAAEARADKLVSGP